MKNNKGQALVEFVMVLPVIILVLITIIDFGNIITKKYSLENDLDYVSTLAKQTKYDDINNYINDKNITINYQSNDNLLKINLKKNVKVISPLLMIIFGNDYQIEAEKSIYKNE